MKIEAIAIFILVVISRAEETQEDVPSVVNPMEADDLVRSKRTKGDYETAYACEDTRLNISCAEDMHLDIIRANYGRFSIAICNEHGKTEWSVNCMSPRTLRVIKARCGNRVQCDLPVDSTIFGDPCPGTYKYVEVHYACRRDPVPLTSTPRPRPPWVVDLGPNHWSTINNHLSGITANTTTPMPNVTDDVITTESSTTTTTEEQPRIIKVKVPKPFDLDVLRQRPKPKIPISISTKLSVPTFDDRPEDDQLTSTEGPDGAPVILENFTQFCPPANSRGLFWNWTRAGDTAVLQCPAGSSGFAKWRCGSNPVEWITASPSLGECRSLWLGDLDTRLRDGESIAQVSGDLAQVSGVQTMFGGDIVLSTRMLKHMAERMHYEIQRTLDPHERESMVTDLVQNVVRTGSHVIDPINHRSWSDLGPEDVGRAATSLMVGIEENAFLLADAVTSEKIIIKPTDNILLSIRVMQSRNTLRQRFPSVEGVDSWHSYSDSIELSSHALLQNGDNGAVRVIFSAFDQLHRLLGCTANCADRLGVSANGTFVNSKVISASLGKGRHIQLPEPVRITLRHLRTENVSRPICVFWDYLENTWSGDGCSVAATNASHTVCRCNHLTHFAVLMHEGSAVHPVGLSSLSTHISTIIACVATVISVAVILFFVVIAWRKFHVSHQCRSILQNSGLPCFHKTKELSEKDKKQGNFYTVTPKLNGSVNNAQGGKTNNQEENEEQQFFEHMIQMQRNQKDTVLKTTTLKRNVNEAEPEGVKLNNLENNKSFKSKTQCQHLTHNEIVYPKRNNYARAMSPYNHIYMEIDPVVDEANYEAVNHSETYMLSTVSDMSEDDYRRTYSDVSRQSSRAEHRPLIRPFSVLPDQRNLLHTISGVLHSQSVRIPAGSQQRRSMLVRYPTEYVQHNTIARGHQVRAEVPLQVTTMNGNQFVCLNINKDQPDQASATYVATSDPYVISGGSARPGQIQAAVHSQSFAHGTMPRAQFAQPIDG